MIDVAAVVVAADVEQTFHGVPGMAVNTDYLHVHPPEFLHFQHQCRYSVLLWDLEWMQWSSLWRG